jgi:sugar lactone lactonase YvrE
MSTLATIGLNGCTPAFGSVREPELIWARRGNPQTDGRFYRPRAMTIDDHDQIYVVDLTGRIQVFDADGNFLRGWRTPAIEQGKPLGLSISQDRQLIVADTHYFRVLFYSREGVMDQSRTIGGVNGDEPGQFHFITDVVQAPNGHFYIGHYGQNDLIQEFDPVGKFIRRWGSLGGDRGQFSRAQSIVMDDKGLLWITDSCNHRIQAFQLDGSEPELVKIFGKPGSRPGELNLPYGLTFDLDGTLLVSEIGNHRVQRFNRDGQSLEAWGKPGKESGHFDRPFAMAIDSKHRLHVLDTNNHRVQRFQL